jgi:hypothetical protein
VAVTGDSYYFVFEKKAVKLFVQCHDSPSHRQAGTPMLNTQSTLRAFPDLCKNVSLAVLFGNSTNSYTVSTTSVYVSSQYREAGQAK